MSVAIRGFTALMDSSDVHFFHRSLETGQQDTSSHVILGILSGTSPASLHKVWGLFLFVFFLSNVECCIFNYLKLLMLLNKTSTITFIVHTEKLKHLGSLIFVVNFL